MRYLNKIYFATEDSGVYELFKRMAKEAVGYETAVINKIDNPGAGEMDFPREEETKEAYLVVTDSSRLAEKLNKSKIPYIHYKSSKEENAGDFFSKYVFEGEEAPFGEYYERIYRRYIGIPWDITETERLVIRETTEDDVDDFFEIYKDPEMTEYNEGLYPTIEEEKAYQRGYIEKIYGFWEMGIWTLSEKATGEIIGRAGLTINTGEDDPELGFAVGKRWQRKGYAYEACRAILEYGKKEMGYTGYCALAEEGNTASRKLLSKLGFIYRGEKRIKNNREYMIYRYSETTEN